MRPKPEDLVLVQRVAGIIDSSRLKKATVKYLWDRLRLPDSEYSHLCAVLKKYFKKDVWSRQDWSHYYVPRKNLQLPKADLSIPPEDPPDTPIPGSTKPPFCPGTFASHVFEAEGRREAERDAERDKENK